MALRKLFSLHDHQKTIKHLASGAELTVNAADADVITGSLVDGTLIDETHVFAQRSNAADIFLEMCIRDRMITDDTDDLTLCAAAPAKPARPRPPADR